MTETTNFAINLDKLRTIVQKYGSSSFTTAQLLHEYQGGYYGTIGTRPNEDLNQQFAELLHHNAVVLGIHEVRSNAPAFDNSSPPHATFTSVWQAE